MIDENNHEQEIDEVEELPEVEEGQDDTVDYKALVQKQQGMLKRFQTRLKKLSENPPVKPEVKQEVEKKEILDRVDRAVLSVKGITEPEEIELVEKRKSETGRSLEELLSTNWFKQELQEFRDHNMTSSAIPSGSKRSGQAARDSVEYWIQKGELPPKGQVQLRRDVVNARMQKAKDGNIFSDNPVV